MRNKKYINININIISFIILFTLLPYHALSQNNNSINMPDKSKYYNYGSNLYTDIYTVPNSNLDSLRIYFFYKVHYNELIFKLNSNNKYYAIINIEATIKDNEGITRKRILTNDTIIVDNYEETLFQKLYFTNLISFNVINNDYNIKIHLSNCKTGYLNKDITKTIYKYSKLQSNNNLLLNPYFVYHSSEQSENTYTPLITNGNIPFTANSFSILLPFLTTNKETSEFEYTISSQDNNNNQITWQDFKPIKGLANILPNIKIECSYDSIPVLNLIKTNFNTQNTIGLLQINPSYNSFSPGLYDLTIVNSKTKEKEVFTFEVIWINIPISLLDINYAIDAMYYILDDKTYNELNSGNKAEKYKKLFNYWNNKYPSSTSYNNIMATYFQRVDYAFFNYSTIVEKDGAKTSRGNIYILNGQPNKIENIFINNNSYEIWYYYKINKKYIFNIISVGNYKLEKIETIKDNTL